MSGTTIIEFIGALMVLAGSIMAVISAIGIVRLPDVFNRSHASTKSSTLAVLLTLTGVFIYAIAAIGSVSVRLILGILFVFLTAPVSGHLITRAGYRSKVKMSDRTMKDELAEDIRKGKEMRSEEFYNEDKKDRESF